MVLNTPFPQVLRETQKKEFEALVPSGSAVRFGIQMRKGMAGVSAQAPTNDLWLACLPVGSLKLDRVTAGGTAPLVPA